MIKKLTFIDWILLVLFSYLENLDFTEKHFKKKFKTTN